jgi:Lectin C-type domain
VSRLAFTVFAVLVELTGCRFDLPTSKPDAIAPATPDAAGDAALVADCPAGYGPIKGIGMYRVVEGALRSWQAAAADCKDDDDTGGSYRLFTHLVVLGNDAERTTITGVGTSISGNTWIGLSDLAIEGTYVWITPEPTGGYPMIGMKPPWDTDDPDDAGGSEDCIRFKNDFTLEDRPCTDAESYVCECDAFAPN